MNWPPPSPTTAKAHSTRRGHKVPPSGCEAPLPSSPRQQHLLIDQGAGLDPGHHRALAPTSSIWCVVVAGRLEDRVRRLRGAAGSRRDRRTQRALAIHRARQSSQRRPRDRRGGDIRRGRRVVAHERHWLSHEDERRDAVRRGGARSLFSVVRDGDRISSRIGVGARFRGERGGLLRNQADRSASGGSGRARRCGGEPSPSSGGAAGARGGAGADAGAPTLDGGSGGGGEAGLAETGGVGTGGAGSGGTTGGTGTGGTAGGAGSGGTTGGTGAGGTTGGASAGTGGTTPLPGVTWLSLDGDLAPASLEPNGELAIDGRFYAHADDCATLNWDPETRCATGTCARRVPTFRTGASPSASTSTPRDPTARRPIPSIPGTRPRSARKASPGASAATPLRWRCGSSTWTPRTGANAPKNSARSSGHPTEPHASCSRARCRSAACRKDDWNGSGIDYEFDPAAVHALQFKLPAIVAGAAEFSFCIDDLGLVR